MSERIPRAALEVLEEGVLCHLAVATRHGPHLTPVVYALHAGRLWVTTSRSSVKARAWRSRQDVAGLVRHEGLAVAFRGRVRTYDALDPLSWPGAVAGAPRIAKATAKFSLKNARFFAGYAVDANKVPLSWSPPGRVFVAVELTAGRLLSAAGPEGPGWGAWTANAAFRKTFRPGRRARGLDRSVPSDIPDAIGDEGDGALALDDDDRLTVLPARWRRVGTEGAYEAVLPKATLALAHADLHPRTALTVDRASSWRASAMTGMLLQGPGELYAPDVTTRGVRALRQRVGRRDDALALVRILPRRVVWWQGWTSGRVGRMSGAAS